MDTHNWDRISKINLYHAAVKDTTAGLKSNNRMSQSAGSNAELAGKWVLKVVLLIIIVYILSTKPAWLPVLLKELTEGTEHSAFDNSLSFIDAENTSTHFDAAVSWSACLKKAFKSRWLVLLQALRNFECIY